MSAAPWIETLKSADAARWAVTALLLAIAVDAALMLTHVLSRAEISAPSAVTAAPLTWGARPSQISAQAAAIANRHLFGTPPAPTGADAPATSMPLVLTGVVADRDESKGRAFIGDAAANTKVYAVGAQLPGGARLHSVFADHVLLERDGALETLRLPHGELPGGVRPASAGAIGTSNAVFEAAANSISKLVRMQPAKDTASGKFIGVRIFPAGPEGAAAISQQGLHAGDVITSVNGTALEDPVRSMEVLGSLSTAGTAALGLTRDGQTMEVNINVAALVNDASASQAAANTPADVPGAAPAIAPPGVPGIFRHGHPHD